MGVEMNGRAPAYRGPVLHFDAPRLAALREGGRIEETLATENEGKFIYVHLRTCPFGNQGAGEHHSEGGL